MTTGLDMQKNGLQSERKWSEKVKDDASAILRKLCKFIISVSLQTSSVCLLPEVPHQFQRLLRIIFQLAYKETCDRKGSTMVLRVNVCCSASVKHLMQLRDHDVRLRKRNRPTHNP